LRKTQAAKQDEKGSETEDGPKALHKACESEWAQKYANAGQNWPENRGSERPILLILRLY
jgi:hypothetical protein